MFLRVVHFTYRFEKVSGTLSKINADIQIRGQLWESDEIVILIYWAALYSYNCKFPLN